MTEKPKAGQVYEYRYLWCREALKGQEEGRKSRPSCVAVAVRAAQDQTVLFLAAITTKAPQSDQVCLAITPLEAKRAGLDTDRPLWVVIDELNIDIWERSFDLEKREPNGAFSETFTKSIATRIRQLRSQGKLQASKRV
jgi:hypothetical protein